MSSQIEQERNPSILGPLAGKGYGHQELGDGQRFCGKRRILVKLQAENALLQLTASFRFSVNRPRDGAQAEGEPLDRECIQNDHFRHAAPTRFAFWYCQHMSSGASSLFQHLHIKTTAMQSSPCMFHVGVALYCCTCGELAMAILECASILSKAKGMNIPNVM